MVVTIAGGHGQIARRLARILVARGNQVRGLIRNADHAGDLRADGSEPVVCDLESAAVEEVAAALGSADAVVFAAGAGPGSGTERKWTMDRDGAVKLIEAARAAGAKRYVMISSLGAQDPPDGDEVFAVYLRAKAEADHALAATELDWTIVRPGMLTEEAGDGRVRVQAEPVRGSVPRDDVAQVLAAVLHEPRSAHATLYVVDGDAEVEHALEAALR